MVSKLQQIVSAPNSCNSCTDFSVKSPPTFTIISKSEFCFTILQALTACFPLYPYPPEQLTRGICAYWIDLTAVNISSLDL